MNCIVINGSPKVQRSNTIQLARAFVEGAGWENVETIDIAKISLKACIGCYVCWTKTPGKCVLPDDMNSILEKLVSADVIVWSFPLYSHSVPGGLKNFIDRQLPLNLPVMDKKQESGGHPLRYDVSKQQHILISTCGFWTAKGNYDGVDFMFSRSVKDSYESIYCGQGELFSIEQLKEHTNCYLATVRKAGSEYAQSGKIDENTKLSLAEPLFPKEVFEKMADGSWEG